MVQLVVTEKPSVARDLARIMGVRGKRDGYLEGDRIWITWCYGHLVTLAEPERQDASWKRWSRDTLPMIPESFELDTIASSREQYGVVRRLLRSSDIDEVINACDAGREGELIFRYVYELAGCRKAVRRLWLASLTDQSVRQAWRAMRPGSDYDALGDAARSRAEADWLVGLNATRAMTIQSRRAGSRSGLMSVGRVQTPTLALLAERERAIEEFVPEPFWQVFATFDASPQDDEIPTTYEGVWTRAEDPDAAKPSKDETPQERRQRYKEERERRERLKTQEEARAIVDAVSGETGEVMRVHERDVRERPPLLFDLTALQREANRRFGFSAKRTLDIAQSLYERHKLLTYPRTDSRHLTKDMRPKLEGLLENLSVGSYQSFCEAVLAKKLKVTKRMVDDTQVTDHHAIIPTEKTPSSSGLDRDEIRIYDLVARRFIAGFCPDAVFATTRIETTVGEHLFVTRGRSRKQAGWQEVEGMSASRSGGEGREASGALLPSLARGKQAPVESTRV
ncbi:MAG: DNA topoisomerase, partial [Myxococcota bacterium]